MWSSKNIYKNKCRKKALKVNPFFDLEINLNYCYNACKNVYNLIKKC